MKKVLLYPFYRWGDWGSRVRSDLSKATKPITGRDLSRAQTLYCAPSSPPGQPPLIQAPEWKYPRTNGQECPTQWFQSQLWDPQIRLSAITSDLRTQPAPLRIPQDAHRPQRGRDTSQSVTQEEIPYQALLHFLEDGIFFVGIQNQGVQLSLPQADQEGHTPRTWDRIQVASPGERWGGWGKEGRGCSVFARELITELIRKWWFSPVMSWLLWAGSKPPTIVLFYFRKQTSHNALLSRVETSFPSCPSSMAQQQDLRRGSPQTEAACWTGWGEVRRKEMKKQKKKETKRRKKWNRKWRGKDEERVGREMTPNSVQPRIL